MHSYKSGNNPEAQGMSDADALDYANANGILLPIGAEEQIANDQDQDAIAAQLQLQEAPSPDAQGEVDDTPQTKAGKKTPASRKRKGDEEATPAATPASPAQKRRRASTKPNEDKEEPKKAGRKKASKA